MKGFKNKGLVCWSKDAQAAAFRIELDEGGFYVIPYTELEFVRFETKNDVETLQVMVTSHEFRFSGKNLRELGLGFQQFAVEWVKELPSRYDSIADEGQVWINSIAVGKVGNAMFPNGNRTSHPGE
jgi:hypothetical protein